MVARFLHRRLAIVECDPPPESPPANALLACFSFCTCGASLWPRNFFVFFFLPSARLFIASDESSGRTAVVRFGV